VHTTAAITTSASSKLMPPSVLNRASSAVDVAKQAGSEIYRRAEETSDLAVSKTVGVVRAVADSVTSGLRRAGTATLDYDDEPEEETDWEKHLDNCAFLYQCASHAVTKFSKYTRSHPTAKPMAEVCRAALAAIHHDDVGQGAFEAHPRPPCARSAPALRPLCARSAPALRPLCARSAPGDATASPSLLSAPPWPQPTLLEPRCAEPASAHPSQERTTRRRWRRICAKCSCSRRHSARSLSVPSPS
jgi:hypothetical protein